MIILHYTFLSSYRAKMKQKRYTERFFVMCRDYDYNETEIYKKFFQSFFCVVRYTYLK